MKTVLLVAYFFPPLGGGGVQRSLKFTRYLPENGWRPLVITARASRYWLEDPSLLAELPEETRVERVFSPDGVWLASLAARGRARTVRGGASTSRARRLAAWALLPDVYRPWKPFALRAARRLMRETRVDAILTTSSPDSAHLIGLDLRAESGVPWVADFRDPWTRRIAFDPPSRWHRRLHEGMERRVLEAASAVVVTTRETGEEFIERVRIPSEKVAVIPNGFDPEDFAGIDAAPSREQFSLRYVGQLTAGRTLAPILDVLDAFLDRRPDARAKLDVRFIGPREIENDALVHARGYGDVVHLEDPCPHRDAVGRLLEAHVVLLVESPLPRSGLIAQGKLYECLYTSRPILAVAPRGAVSRLLTEHGGGAAVTPGEPEAGARFLERAYDAWVGGRPLGGASRDDLAIYDRRHLAARLAERLDAIT